VSRASRHGPTARTLPQSQSHGSAGEAALLALVVIDPVAPAFDGAGCGGAPKGWAPVDGPPAVAPCALTAGSTTGACAPPPGVA
jgi:hypothetical protein